MNDLSKRFYSPMYKNRLETEPGNANIDKPVKAGGPKLLACSLNEHSIQFNSGQFKYCIP